MQQVTEPRMQVEVFNLQLKVLFYSFIYLKKNSPYKRWGRKNVEYSRVPCYILSTILARLGYLTGKYPWTINMEIILKSSAYTLQSRICECIYTYMHADACNTASVKRNAKIA